MSDAQGQSLLNFLDAPVLVGDPEGRIIFANDAFVRELCPNGASPNVTNSFEDFVNAIDASHCRVRV